MCKFRFATPLRKASSPNVAKQLFHIFVRALYIPKTDIFDMGTVFTARVMMELSRLLEIKLEYATVKQASFQLTSNKQYQILYQLGVVAYNEKKSSVFPTTSSESQEAFRTLAEPIAMKMVQLRNPFEHSFAQYSTLKTILVIGLGSFLLSILLHLLFLYLFHRYHQLQ